MFKPILAVAVLLGSAVSSPAQVRIEGNLGHGLRVAAVFGDCFPGYGEAPRWHQAGHWETVREEVWVPGYWRDTCVPARCGWVREYGHRRWAVIEPECHRRIWVPGHNECRSRQVWVAC
jgi:hypothetical protein